MRGIMILALLAVCLRHFCNSASLPDLKIQKQYSSHGNSHNSNSTHRKGKQNIFTECVFCNIALWNPGPQTPPPIPGTNPTECPPNGTTTSTTTVPTTLPSGGSSSAAPTTIPSSTISTTAPTTTPSGSSSASPGSSSSSPGPSSPSPSGDYEGVELEKPGQKPPPDFSGEGENNKPPPDYGEGAGGGNKPTPGGGSGGGQKPPDFQGGGTNPGESGGTNPGGSGGTNPEGSGGTNPGETGGTNPGGSGGTNPGETGGTNPGETGGTNPGGSGGTNPGETGGTNPGGSGGSNPGETGGTNPGGSGGTNPGETGGTNPGGSGGSNPGETGGTNPGGSGGGNQGEGGQTGTGGSGGGNQGEGGQTGTGGGSSGSGPGGTVGDIFLGYPAKAEWFPYTVLLLISSADGTSICSGSIFTPYTIITAAHCVYDKRTLIDSSRSTVVAGSEQGLIGEQMRRIQKFVPHPAYNGSWVPSEDRNDIALAILQQPLIYNNATIVPIKLAPDDRRKNGTGCYLSAYGSQTGPGGNDAGRKQWSPMFVRPDSDCEKAYPKTIFDPKMNVCAGGNGKSRQCSGDSGGPLACEYQNTLMLYGVVDASVKDNPAQPGVACSDPAPGTYAYVPFHANWINANAKYN